MDQQAIDYTRDHYNKHVKHQDSREVRLVYNTEMLSNMNCPALHAVLPLIHLLSCLKQALRARKEGPSLPLKELHNDVKRQLIYK